MTKKLPDKMDWLGPKPATPVKMPDIAKAIRDTAKVIRGEK